MTLGTLPPNLEIFVEGLRHGRPCSFYGRYFRHRWAGLEKRHKALEGSFRSLGYDLYLSLGQIANPSGQREELGLTIGPVAVANPLNSSLHPCVNLMNRHVHLDYESK